MKLALGTVQFGLPYGINNSSGRVKPDEVTKILRLADFYGIDTLDTAIDYGESERTLGQSGVSNWKVITKLPAVPEVCVNVEGWLFEHIEHSLERLKVNQLYGVLLHRPNQLLGKHGAHLIQALSEVKRLGLAKKIGVSIYTPAELDALPLNMTLDIVQAPLNILDRQLVTSGWSKKLKDNGIELHARSVFLQGLLLMTPEERPEKFSQFEQTWNQWSGWLMQANLTPLQACLAYAVNIAQVDKVIVGVDSEAHLEQIIAASNAVLPSLLAWQQPIDPLLTNPSRWAEL